MSANRSDSSAMKRSGFLPGLALGVVILLAGAGIFRSAGAAAAQGGPQPATIEVEATGEVRAQPDIATLTPAVETQASTVEEARAANARASQALLQAVKGALQEKEKIQSVSYRLYPVYRSVEKVRAGRKIRTREIVGYKAEHVFRLELRDRVGGPYFDHSRRDELQRQAAVQALKRARKLAEALARAADLKVIRLKKVSTAPPFRPIRAFAREAKALAEVAPETPVEVGEEKFQARITVVFEVGP